MDLALVLMADCSLGYPLFMTFSSPQALPCQPCCWLSTLGQCRAPDGCCAWGAGRASLQHGAAECRARFSPCLEREDCSVKVHASLSAICPVFAAVKSRGSCLSAVRVQVAEGRESRELCHTAVPKPCHVSRLSWGGSAGALGAAAQQAPERQCLDLSPAARASPRTVVSPVVLVSWSAWWHCWWLFGPSYTSVLLGPWERPQVPSPQLSPWPQCS